MVKIRYQQLVKKQFLPFIIKQRYVRVSGESLRPPSPVVVFPTTAVVTLSPKSAVCMNRLVPVLTTPTSHPQSQRGSRSKHAQQEVSSSWAGAEDLKKVDEELDISMDPSGSPSRWKTSSTSSSSQPQG